MNIETYLKTISIFRIQIYFMCGYFFRDFAFIWNSNMNVNLFIIGEALPKNEIRKKKL
jgi:hypothetical protein